MIERYAHPAIAHEWSQERQIEHWARIERTVAKHQGALGVIPSLEAAAIVAFLREIDPAAVAAREQTTRHDVAAFLAVARDQLLDQSGSTLPANWLHFGLTSSDLTDTALAMTIQRVAAAIDAAADQLCDNLVTWANNTVGTTRIGRTHGQYADPIQMDRVFARLHEQAAAAAHVHREMAVVAAYGKLSGPVGNYAYSPKAVECAAAKDLGVWHDTVCSQIVPRWRHAHWAYSLVTLAGACEAIATEVRLSAQADIAEISEGFADGDQIGSSAMPHKRNPIRAERLCGLARVARGYLNPIIESASVLWQERDISNSSVERVALADLSILVHWMLVETVGLVRDMRLDADMVGLNLRLALQAMGGSSSASQLVEAVKAGKDRDEAYRAIQRGEKP